MLKYLICRWFQNTSSLKIVIKLTHLLMIRIPSKFLFLFFTDTPYTRFHSFFFLRRVVLYRRRRFSIIFTSELLSLGFCVWKENIFVKMSVRVTTIENRWSVHCKDVEYHRKAGWRRDIVVYIHNFLCKKEISFGQKQQQLSSNLSLLLYNTLFNKWNSYFVI